MYRTVLFSETTNQIGNRCDPIQGNFNNLFNELESSKGLRLARLATSRPWGREGAGKGTRDPSDEVASGRLVSLAGI